MKLLESVGYNAANPLKVDIYTADMIPGIVNMVQLYKQQAAKAGIQVNVITGPASEYWDNVWLKQPFQVSAWSARPAGLALSITYLRQRAVPGVALEGAGLRRVDPEGQHHRCPRPRAAPSTRRPARCSPSRAARSSPCSRRSSPRTRSNCSGYVPSIQFVQFDLTKLQCK